VELEFHRPSPERVAAHRVQFSEYALVGTQDFFGSRVICLQPDTASGIDQSVARRDVTMGLQQFRLFAEACVQMAKEAANADHRSRLMDMAEAWGRLAEEAERFEQLVRDVDETFDAPEMQEFRPHRRSH
jgi:hypothetical protein